jgi:hypothetical protein
VLGDVALDEDTAALRVEPDGEQVERRVTGVAPEHRRVDLVGEGVQVDHAVVGVAVVLERHPVPEGPQVVAQGEVARGGDAGEDPFHGSPWYVQCRGAPDRMRWAFGGCAARRGRFGIVGV